MPVSNSHGLPLIISETENTMQFELHLLIGFEHETFFPMSGRTSHQPDALLNSEVVRPPRLAQEAVSTEFIDCIGEQKLWLKVRRKNKASKPTLLMLNVKSFGLNSSSPYICVKLVTSADLHLNLSLKLFLWSQWSYYRLLQWNAEVNHSLQLERVRPYCSGALLLQ